MSDLNLHTEVTHTPRARKAPQRAYFALVLCCAAGCGVIEYPHDQALIDPSNDFGPAPPAGGTPAATTAGTTAPTAAPGNAGQSGAPVGVGGAGRAATPSAGSVAMPTAGRAGPPVAGMAGMPAAGAATPPPPAANSLNLGGTPVAKEDVIAFIHFGHSNMAGRATSPSSSRAYFFTETDPHAWMYHVGKMPELAKEPYTANDDLSGMYAGPGTALIKQAVKMAPNKYFMSLGFGRSSAYCSQFLPGSLYYDSLSKAAIAIKDRVTFGAIVIMLGITERHGTSADISGYPDCINKLVTRLRADVGRPDLPLLITDYEQEASGMLAVNSSFAQMIIPQIRKVPTVVSNSVLVPTNGLGMQDDHHFNLEGHKVWTQRVLDLMKSKGWFPWAQ